MVQRVRVKQLRHLDMDALSQIATWLATADSAVAFTGAGISTESGIQDYRSPGGIWSTSQPVYFDDFLNRPAARYEYWRQKSIAHRDFLNSKPNLGHQTLANWERHGYLRGVITQNIDGLHQDAGSRRVLELHGTARFIACLGCSFRQAADSLVQQFLAEDLVPVCPECGGLLKHATISFGQALPHEVLNEAAELSSGADLFFAIGSSLVVEPAASLPRLAKQCGARLIIINREATPQDPLADVVLNAPIGEMLAEIDARLT